jgi:ABC-type nitrate/sulfonate/bicarbonate transport system permease component
MSVDVGRDRQNVVRIEPGSAERNPQRWSKIQSAQGVALALCITVCIFVLWQLASDSGVIDRRIFSSPLQVVEQGWDMILSGELWQHVSVTATRVAVGYVVGAFLGATLGLLIGWSPLARTSLKPLFSALYTIPKLGIFPFMLLIFGITEMAKYALVGISTFLLVVLGTLGAVTSVPRSYLDAAAVFNSSRWRTFVNVIVPGSLSQVFTSFRLAIGYAVLVVIGTEFVSADSGVGWLIWNSWSLFQADTMFVGIVVSALMGLVAASVVGLAERWLMPWNRS